VVREFNTFWVRQESQTVMFRSGAESVVAQTAAILGGLFFTLVLRRTQA
jgi:preprotein translocase subunit SecG